MPLHNTRHCRDNPLWLPSGTKSIFTDGPYRYWLSVDSPFLFQQIRYPIINVDAIHSKSVRRSFCRGFA
ncbi:hypothetical protein BGP_3087 [Beggiatoa sp. PS]|nr:hypothetical protein BGP_3087 [Beggiatoa sp. PS]